MGDFKDGIPAITIPHLNIEDEELLALIDKNEKNQDTDRIKVANKNDDKVDTEYEEYQPLKAALYTNASVLLFSL